MPKSMPIIEARNKLTLLPEQLAEGPESGDETLDILSDEKMMRALRQGIREVAAGKGIPWDQAKRRLQR